MLTRKQVKEKYGISFSMITYHIKYGNFKTSDDGELIDEQSIVDYVNGVTKPKEGRPVGSYKRRKMQIIIKGTPKEVTQQLNDLIGYYGKNATIGEIIENENAIN